MLGKLSQFEILFRQASVPSCSSWSWMQLQFGSKKRRFAANGARWDWSFKWRNGKWRWSQPPVLQIPDFNQFKDLKPLKLKNPVTKKNDTIHRKMIPQTTQCYNSTHLYKMHNIYLSPSCIKCGRVGGDYYETSLVRNETQHFGASTGWPSEVVQVHFMTLKRLDISGLA